MQVEAWIRQFEELGVVQVRLMVQSSGFPTHMNIHAAEWLAKKARESHAQSEAARAEDLEISRSARDAAREANEIASAANSLAESANTIARVASASAARSADAARTNNKIAAAALIAAVAAVIISMVSIFIKT